MVVYKNRRTSVLKWILGLVIFVLGMTITFSDVHGFNFPSRAGGPDMGESQPGGQGMLNPFDMTNQGQIDTAPETSMSPPQVPEPGTLVLLTTGLAGLYFARRKHGK